MVKSDYVIREDGNSCMFIAESELLDTNVILDEYQCFYKPMSNERYFLKNFLCHVFHEIVYENKVVGFATYDLRNRSELVLTECYILPEFRGKRLFFDEICKMYASSPKFGILQPTRNVMELLISYAFAKKVTEGIIVSAIDLHFDPFDVRSNKRKGILNLPVPPTNFYDLSINSTVLVHDNEVFYHDLLENDRLRGHKRKKLKKGYFVHIKNQFSKNRIKFEKLIVELKKELPDNRLGYDVIVGHGDGLSDYMYGMINRWGISHERLLDIRNQLIEEYESEKIDDDSIEERLYFLANSLEGNNDNFSEYKKMLDSLDDSSREVREMKDFMDVIGDDEELGNEIVDALIMGDAEALNEILVNNVEVEDLMDMGNDDFDYAAYKQSNQNFIKEIIEGKYKLDSSLQVKYSPSNHDHELFMILKMLNRGKDYHDAISSIEYDTLTSPAVLTGLLIDSNFIKKEGVCEFDWVNDGLKLPKDDLKVILMDNNLDYSGNKKDLLKRLADNNITLGDNYKITPEGKNFLRNHPMLAFYWEFFDFCDFEDYSNYLENHKGNLKEASLDYIKEHLKLARRSNDEEYLEDCIAGKADLMEFGDELLCELNNIE